LNHERTENNLPYALFGDSGSGYNGWTPESGTYELTVTPYPENDRGGISGDPVTISFSVTSYDCTSQSEISLGECEALTELYSMTSGSGWNRNDDWLASAFPCSWYGVTCSSGAVDMLELSNNQLSGSIPPEIGDLSDLRYLHLNINQLNGAIPAELGDLAQLRRLRLYQNELIGVIPSELGNLSQLRHLLLGENQLIGPIPATLGGLANLRTLKLNSNHLTGPIWPVMGSLSNLDDIDLSNNQLTDAVPYSFAAIGANASMCDLTGNASLCMPNLIEYQDLGDPICGLPLEDTCILLPVELMLWEAVATDHGVALNWETASEEGLAGFEIQHSVTTEAHENGQATEQLWHSVAFLESKGGSGEPNTYSHVVSGLDPGSHRFRLKQIDLDGDHSFSKEVEVLLGVESGYVISGPWPNPVSGRAMLKLAVSSPQTVRLTLYDALGRCVRIQDNRDLPANQTVRFQISADGLASGMYMLHITGETFRADRTMVVLR
jgi:hypothetical protein